MPVADMIKLFGGTSKLATLLGIPISTVHAWKRFDYVPAWRQPKILELANERKLPIAATDFPERKVAA